jgi:nucleoside-diphosphate-sugar epimerase
MGNGKPVAFVAGATGFTGREVAAELVRSGVKTFAHVRPDSARLVDWQVKFSGLGAEVDSTAWDEKALTETFKRLKPDYVFCLIGTTKARMKQVAKAGKNPQAQGYEAIDFGLTNMLLKAALAAGIKPRFVYLSAAGAGEKAASAYGRTRWKAEQAVVNSGLDYVIARPSFIIGPDRDDNRPAELIGAKLIDFALAGAKLFGGRKLWARYRSNSNVTLAKALVRHGLDRSRQKLIVESEDLH